MNMGEIVDWVEHHPTESIIIGAGGIIAVLWLLGYIGGGGQTQSADQGTQNMAAAYYAAEQAQAVVGGQIQMTTLNDAAAVAINASNNNAAEAITNTQANAAQTMNSQNVNGAIALGGQNLQATYSNNAAAVQVAQSNNNTAAQIGEMQLSAVNAQVQSNNFIAMENQIAVANANSSWF